MNELEKILIESEGLITRVLGNQGSTDYYMKELQSIVPQERSVYEDITDSYRTTLGYLHSRVIHDKEEILKTGTQVTPGIMGTAALSLGIMKVYMDYLKEAESKGMDKSLFGVLLNDSTLKVSRDVLSILGEKTIYDSPEHLYTKVNQFFKIAVGENYRDILYENINANILPR